MVHDLTRLNTLLVRSRDNNGRKEPPTWADRFLEWYCAPHQLEDVQGALYEYYFEKIRGGQEKRAKRMFVLDVLMHFRPHIVRRDLATPEPNQFAMYQSFIKLSFRNFKKYRLSTFLNLAGLSIGIASLLLITLWIRHEQSFDQFHTHAENIYRISNTFTSETESFSQAPSGPALGAQLHEIYPQIVNGTRYGTNSSTITVGDESYFENDIALADRNFLDMFDWQVIEGEKSQFFTNINSIVLTESMAGKYFGSQSALGKEITMDGEVILEVSGVIADLPTNSQLQFESLICMDLAKKAWGIDDMDDRWGGGWFHTYLQLEAGTDVAGLMEEVNTFITSKLTYFTERNMSYEYFLQPLTSIHLQSDLRYDFGNNGNARNVAIFSIVALIILLLAAINYINLSTANAIRRAKSVGIKKVIGAKRSQLVSQYLVESVLVSLLSASIAIGLIGLFLPKFQTFIGYELAYQYHPIHLLWVVAGAGLLGLTAGLFPALAISSFKPLSVLRGQLTRGRRGTFVRKSLVVFQFTATIVLLIAIITVDQQMRHLQNQDLGMNTDEVISINFRGLQQVVDNRENLTNRLLENPAFTSVSFHRRAYPVRGLSNGMIQVETGSGERVSSSLYHMWVDEAYADTYEMDLVAGRFFSREFGSDSTAAVLVNEAAVEAFAWGSPEEALGRKMGTAPNERSVIGVVRNFNFEGLHKQVEPLRILPETRGDYSRIAVKANLSRLTPVIEALESTWREVNPGIPLDYTFMNDDIQNQYQAESRFRSIFLIFSILSIVIAGLGLFGLVTASTNQRLREIGIRKVLGASTFGLVGLLGRDFLILVGIALVLAIPIAWYGMETWLSDFAYRIPVSWIFFAAAGLIAVGVTILTMSYQTLRAAYADPTNVLRSE